MQSHPALASPNVLVGAPHILLEISRVAIILPDPACSKVIHTQHQPYLFPFACPLLGDVN